MFIDLAASEKNRKQKFLEEMQEILPWGTLEAMCRKHWKEEKIGRPKYDILLLLKVYFIQQWYNLGDPTAEAEIYDSIAFRRFLKINDLGEGIPDETTILRFRHFLNEHRLPEKFFKKTTRILKEKGHIVKTGTIVDATIISASSSTKNKEKKRDPEMSSTRKNNNFHFGMKQHIGVDSGKGMIHTIQSTTAKTHDIKMLDACLHGGEIILSGDKAYGSKERKQQMRKEGKIYLITDKATRRGPLSNAQKKKNNKISRMRGKVEHPFRIIKHLWGHRKVRYKGIKKNNLQWNTLAMLCNYYMLAKYKRFNLE